LETHETLKQLKLGEDTRYALKAFAAQEGIFLKQLYQDAVRWFLASNDPEYLASPRDGVYISIWLPHPIVREVRSRAEEDSQPQNRVIYTSLVKYLAKHSEKSI
jgi:hypothetical protein